MDPWLCYLHSRCLDEITTSTSTHLVEIFLLLSLMMSPVLLLKKRSIHEPEEWEDGRAMLSKSISPELN